MQDVLKIFYVRGLAQINIVKIVIFPKVISILNIITIKTAMVSFTILEESTILGVV